MNFEYVCDQRLYFHKLLRFTRTEILLSIIFCILVAGSRGKGRGLLRFSNGSSAVDGSSCGTSCKVEWVSSTWPADAGMAVLASAALNNNNNYKTCVNQTQMPTAVMLNTVSQVGSSTALHSDFLTAANSVTKIQCSNMPVMLTPSYQSTPCLSKSSMLTAPDNSTKFSAALEQPFLPSYSSQLQQQISRPHNAMWAKTESILKTVSNCQVSGHPFAVIPFLDGSNTPDIASTGSSNTTCNGHSPHNQPRYSNTFPYQKLCMEMKGFNELSASVEPFIEAPSCPQSALAGLYPLITDTNAKKTTSASDQYPANLLSLGVNPQAIIQQTNLPLSLIPFALAQTLIAQNQMPSAMPLSGPVPYPISDNAGIPVCPRPPPGLENVLIPLQPEKPPQLSQSISLCDTPLVSLAETAASRIVPIHSERSPTMQAVHPLLEETLPVKVQESIISKPRKWQANCETANQYNDAVSNSPVSLDALAKVFIPKVFIDKSVVSRFYIVILMSTVLLLVRSVSSE